MNKWFVLAFCSLSLLAFSPPANWLRVKTRQYTIQYPPTWKSNRTGLAGTKLILIPPKDTGMLSPYVSLTSQPESDSTVSIDSILHLNEMQLPYSIEEFNLVSKQTITIHDRTCFRLVYTGIQNGNKLKWLQQGCLVGKEFYVLTYAASPQAYTQNEAEVLSVFDTIEFFNR